MKLSDLPGMKGKWIKKEELESPTTYTIKSIGVEDVGPEEDRASKTVIYFEEEEERGWLPNKTCLVILGQKLGGDTDTWTGQKVTLYHDKNVRFSGKRVGGIMVQD